ncbi:hypothetical protein HET69_22980 [Streptomyces sp. CJ_13]|uniref:DUF2716 domain-containing protein n=1 Tax=Streptomyces TaxID=1883 RepID=UPI001BDCA47D|nr:DUF2716 domain-containing protein [Streptomyces sp. CJ_13]MBT1186781.1 hypothetical protein [Streptomyces sp. CJ_13]
MVRARFAGPGPGADPEGSVLLADRLPGAEPGRVRTAEPGADGVHDLRPGTFGHLWERTLTVWGPRCRAPSGRN